MAGLDTRTGKRNVPPPSAQKLKETKTPPPKVPAKSAVQTAKQSSGSNPGTAYTQESYDQYQQRLMDRVRGAAQQDYDRDVNTARSFQGAARTREMENQTLARAQELNNAGLSAGQAAAAQFATANQAAVTAANLQSANLVNNRMLQNSTERQAHTAGAFQALTSDNNQIAESQRQSSQNVAQQKLAETQGLYSLLGSLNSSFSQGGYKYW